jgi:HEAT repeats
MCGHRCTVIAVCVLALSWVDARGSGQTSAAVETADKKQPADFDEWVFKRAGRSSDTDSVLMFLRERSASDDDLLNVDKLIDLLGHPQPQVRKLSAGKLVKLEANALPALRNALKHDDAEIRRLAKDCIARIESETAITCHLAAVHLLAERESPHTVAMLLRFLPFATDSKVEEQIYYIVDRLGLQAGQPSPLLVNALTDKLPARRALAACILGRVGTEDQRKEARKRLSDESPLVRLRAAQGLLAGKDLSGIPTLINLLDTAAPEIRWQAEELLCWAADYPSNAHRRDDEGAPGKLRAQAWREWWKREGQRMALVTLRGCPNQPALFLVLLRDVENRSTEVRVVGGDGTSRWKVKGSSHLANFYWLGSDRAVWVETQDGAFSIRDHQGKIVNACRTAHLPSSVTRHSVGMFQTTVDFHPDCLVEWSADGRSRQIPLNEGVITPLYLTRSGLIGGRYREGRSEKGRVGFFDGKCDEPFVLADEQIGEALLGIDDVIGAIYSGGNGRVRQVTKNGARTIELPYWRIHSVLPAGESRLAARAVGDGRFPAVLELDLIRGAAVRELIFKEEVASLSICCELVRFGFGADVVSERDVHSVPERVRQLEDRDVWKRLRALTALNRVVAQDPSRRAELRPALAKVIQLLSEEETADIAGNLLLNMGAQALPDVKAAIRDGPDATRRTLLAKLCGQAQCPPELIPLLIETTRKGPAEVRILAIQLLGMSRSENQAVIPVLSELVGAPEAPVAAAAIRTLANFGASAQTAAPDLLKQAKARKGEVSREAIRALPAIHPQPMLLASELVGMLRDDRYREYQVDVIEAAGHMKGAAGWLVPHLAKLIEEEPRRDLAAAAVVAAGRLGKEARAAVPSLSKRLALADAHESRVLKALGQIGPDASSATPEIIKSIRRNAGREGSLIAACDALRAIGPGAKEALEQIKTLLSHPDLDVRFAAQRALTSVQPPE